ncbi:hypothetical protein IFM89_010899 [Coptis chinensis]|uniref:Uncharacterized protein n=1 Tax=Coptis chinensis TaxID=261450 RepID=A0A835IMU0_9MAGN|nr:hypothetical protein IFM89_010899 [Coptis chinensis]
MVMNGGEGWLRRSKRIGAQRSKKAKQMAEELRSKGKGHLLIPRNAYIVQLSSDLAASNTSEEHIVIDSTTDPSLTESEGTNESITSYESWVSEEIMEEHQAPMEVYFSDDEEDKMVHDTEQQESRVMVGYEADGEQHTYQPPPLAIDDTSVVRSLYKQEKEGQKAQENKGQSSTNLNKQLDKKYNMRSQDSEVYYSGDMDLHAFNTGNLQVASIYAGNNWVQLKGPEIRAELTHLLRLLSLCMLFSKKPFAVFLELAGYSQEDVLLQEPEARVGTHSIKDTLTAATGAVVPFHHSVLHEGGASNLVRYAHCGMVAAARWIAKCCSPCLLNALSECPEYTIKVLNLLICSTRLLTIYVIGWCSFTP